MKKIITILLTMVCMFVAVVPVHAETPGWHRVGSEGWNGKNWYYVYPDGTQNGYGWQFIDGKWYFFENHGKCYLTAVGFIRSNNNDGKEYYCDNETGALITNDWVIVSYHNGVTRAWAGPDGAIDYTNTIRD